jgi:spore maturation protein CgeB
VRIVVFCHTLRSDWNHGNAHFLRGVCSELIERGHDLRVWEPENAWSVQNALNDYGLAAVEGYREAYPSLFSRTYRDLRGLDAMLNGADVVLVHEWNDHRLVKLIGEHRRRGGRYTLLFHDTHHRAATQPDAMQAYDLSGYDAVLAFGSVIRDIYLANAWASRAWAWHEAADTRVFRPRGGRPVYDLVWVGNWGDDERTAELQEFLVAPVRELGLTAKVYGVRYPEHAIRALESAGIEYGGWLPNYKAPEVFADYRMTVHVPRRPYVEALPGIPTIRVFETLACGIPLISAPWKDSEGLFTPGEDFLVARDGQEMKEKMRWVLDHPDQAAAIAAHGRKTVLDRHTCRHRVDELLETVAKLDQGAVELL